MPEACLPRSQIPELELTETVLMRHAEPTARTLGQLKAIGLRRLSMTLARDFQLKLSDSISH